ncbi:flagellar basal body rod protein FlgB [Profundibacterium mesophilum]|uniref:Flagellar basal body rod protein FlgB n=1 Tax=Profundibacterium mesophilum KAUST100406-0324 TaxID=1037889 RepID=A0A921NW24_9RHOB|nr:flagellar basal body protein [Profundibacterium mesophilum]KAF0674618.1 Flagellar basal body rod protein FlgB [Profundibacterium mesophilum KAUST100406-0324]
MKLGELSFFDTASKRMDYLGTRQQVVSANIANADTPGFKAQETASFSSMLDGTRGGGMQVTDARHIAGSAGPGNLRVSDDAAAWETTMDGNTVVLEQQSIKSNEITENYRLATQLYRKGHDLLAVAISGLR